MVALAKKTSVQGAAAWRGRPALHAAHEADQPQHSAVHGQHALLEAAFSEASVKPYPGAVKIAILVGAPTALWIGLFAIAGKILHG